ncbi:glycosyltransferase family 4 protein [archaeon]|nr:glycosyltransferase family 4 protein [archaeon]
MKILMIAPTPFFSDRGGHMRVLEEAKALQKLGHKITIATYPLGKDPVGVEVKRTIKLPGYKKTSPGPSIYKYPANILLFFKSLRLLLSNNYDIIHAHLHEGALIGWAIKLFKKTPLVFDCQGSLVGELSGHGYLKKKGLKHKIFNTLEKFITKRADLIITSNQGVTSFLKEELKAKRVITIEDGVNTNIFHPKKEKAELNLPKDKKIALYLGGLQPHKGIDHLIEAIPFTNKNIHFLIMGYPGTERCKELATKLKIEKRITFTGKIDYNLASNHLALGDIAISPKTLESKEANAKVFNYIGMGLPVVLFDSSSNKNMLGNLGIYAKEKDIKDLAKKINIVIENPKQLKEISKKVRELAVTQYSWDKAGEKIENIHKELKNGMAIRSTK